MLAIVIPYYKINYFEETLKSLSNQTDKRFKVYIGNDASENDPEEIIEKYSSTLNLVYKKFNDNLGSISLVQQWNRCLELLEDEEWVMILGDDDVLSDNVVESFYEKEGKFKNTISVVRFATYKIDEKSEIYSDLYTNPEIEKSSDILVYQKRSSLSEYIFSRKKIDTIKFKEFPLAWYSDLLAVLEFSEFGNIFSINSAHLKIRISPNSISGKNDNLAKKEEAKFLFYKYLLEKVKGKINKQTIIVIEDKWNKVYLNDKKRVDRLCYIILLYLRKGNFKAIFKLFNSIIIKNQN
ncbi:glycosyltransferase family A protein [Flavobacterium helocola]|uniref:Glycosyltransferase family 2 protein n=1 Tax=Flavobacterium helocola TaxID=3139139 RepID=A0ABU9I838_9FLAO